MFAVKHKKGFLKYHVDLMNLNGSKFSWKLKCSCFNKISCLSQHVIRYCYFVWWCGIKSNKKELTPVTTFYPHQDVLHILYFRQGLHWKCFAWKIILLSRIVTFLDINLQFLAYNSTYYVMSALELTIILDTIHIILHSLSV